LDVGILSATGKYGGTWPKLQNILAMLKPVLLKVMQKTRLQLGSLMRLIIADWCSHNNLKRKAKVEYM